MRKVPGSMLTRTPLNLSLVRIAARCRRLQQGRAAERHPVLVVLRDDAVVVGNLPSTSLETNSMPANENFGLVRGEAHLDRRVVVLQQALQLEHGLPRQDHLLLRDLGLQRGLGERQPMPVGGHQRQALALGHEEDAVQVVADVVHRHCEMHLRHWRF